MKGVVFIAVVSAAALGGCAGGKEVPRSTVLADDGYIKISGGCEVYAEGRINFRPRDEVVEVEVDNTGRWFFARSVPRESFSAELGRDEAAEFFGALQSVIENPVSTETASTRAAVIEIYLPLAGETVETTWRELDMKCDVNPLLDLIYEFVDSCAPKE